MNDLKELKEILLSYQKDLELDPNNQFYKVLVEKTEKRIDELIKNNF